MTDSKQLDKQRLLEELRGIQQIVISTCHGGFGLSAEAERRYIELTGDPFNDPVARDDPYLVKIVKELGSKAASGRYASLKIVEVPGGVDWEIEEYDGSEWVAEVHRTWR